MKVKSENNDHHYMPIILEDLKNIDYDKALNIQETLFSKSISLKMKGEETQNTLILCEHTPTITIGKNGKIENLLFNEEHLNKKGVKVFKIDRGGDVTFHGPGQIVGYPIFDLESFNIGLRQYIFNLEEVIIQLLSSYGIKGERFAGAAGVWIDTANPQRIRKICAFGVRSSHYVTMHGFALNVNTDLGYFSLINPCGFIDKGVTSMEKELGEKQDIEKIKQEIFLLFNEVFYDKVSL